MKKILQFLLLFIPFSLFCGGELPEVEPKEPVKQEGKIIEESAPIPCVECDDRVLLPELKGLYFLSEKEHFPEDLSGGVQIKGVHIVDELEFKARMNCFLHHPLTIHKFKCIKKEVIRFFKEKGFLLVAVNPTMRQEVNSGFVVFVVVVAKIGEVKVEGEKYFSASSLKREISLKKGDYITANPLRGDIKWLNNNPFRTVNLIFEKGEGLGESDIVLQVQDRFPVRFYSGYENNGVRGVGISRLSAGFNYGNLFGIGHQLNYQFIMAPDIHKWRAHSLNYVAPLPWRHTLKLLGSYIFSHPHLRKLPCAFSVDGDTEQASFRYIFPVLVWHRINSIVALGGDFKRTNTFIFFGEEIALKKHVEVAQLVLTYDGKLNDSLGLTSVDCNLVMSPARVTHYNRGSNFHTMRPYARSHYIYFRGDLNRLFYFGKYSWLIDATVQLTGNRLVQLEQLNLTGHSAVRGYRESILSADRGLILKNELRFPPLHFLSKKNLRDGLQFLLFVDFGVASNVSKKAYKIVDKPKPHKELVYEEHSNCTVLLSAGPGMRYSLNNNVSAYLDYGQRLHHFHGVKTHHRLHCGITFSY